jgi:hypothetical protein
MPRATFDSHWNHTWVLRSKPKNHSPMVLRSKPLDMCRHRPRSPDHQVLQRLYLTCSSSVLTWSTWSLPYTLVLVDDPRCQPPMVDHSASWVPQSKPHHPSFTTPSPSAWTRLTFTFAVDHCLWAPHLRTTSQETCCTTQLTPRLFQQLNPRRYSSLTITHHTSNHKGTYQPCVRMYSLLDTRIISRIEMRWGITFPMTYSQA